MNRISLTVAATVLFATSLLACGGEVSPLQASPDASEPDAYQDSSEPPSFDASLSDTFGAVSKPDVYDGGDASCGYWCPPAVNWAVDKCTNQYGHRVRGQVNGDM